MSRIYTPGTRGYVNVTTGLGRLLLVMTGAYLVFKPKEEIKKETQYSNFAENLEVTYFSPLNTVGVETKEINDGDIIQGAKDQIQVSYRVTGTDYGKATIKYGNEEKIIDSPRGFPLSFTISKTTVTEELNTNGYLQVQISVTPASAQAEVRTVTFRYEGA
jgi:hypothetical protein